MKRSIRVLSLILALFMLTCAFVACNEKPTGLWENATYTEDKTLGDGANTLSITVEMEEKSIVLTVKTDAATVKDALLEHELIHGEQQSIGFLMTTLIGISADYDVDGAYWAFKQNGEFLMTGIDSTPVTGDAAYEFVYTLAP